MNDISIEERALIACLRSKAEALSGIEIKTADMLRRHANRLESASNSDQYLIDFERYAAHYKGLKDEPVAGVSKSDWSALVEELRMLAKAALRSKGLDRSLVGKLHSMLRKL